MPTKITKISKTKFKIEGTAFITNQELIDDGICLDCGASLPDPVRENRQGGYSELVQYCPGCGSTFTGGI